MIDQDEAARSAGEGGESSREKVKKAGPPRREEGWAPEEGGVCGGIRVWIWIRIRIRIRVRAKVTVTVGVKVTLWTGELVGVEVQVWVRAWVQVQVQGRARYEVGYGTRSGYTKGYRYSLYA